MALQYESVLGLKLCRECKHYNAAGRERHRCRHPIVLRTTSCPDGKYWEESERVVEERIELRSW